MSIEVSNISKNYGNQKALDNVTFSVEKGEIVGFLGPNGAGKSTLMKILTTYLNADGGTAKVNGADVNDNPRKVQQSVGYLPEHNPLYLDLYVREYLAFNASVYGIGKQRVQEVIELTGLTPESHKKISQLSKGYRQRVGLANALLHDPAVLILDEPTTGLDPNQLAEIRQLIKESGRDKTVFLSTHIMQEVEAICDRVIIIDHGKIVADQKIDKIAASATVVLEVQFDQIVDAGTLADLPYLKNATLTQDNLWIIEFSSDEDLRAEVFDFAQRHSLKILQLNQRQKNLEAVFREITGKNKSLES